MRVWRLARAPRVLGVQRHWCCSVRTTVERQRYLRRILRVEYGARATRATRAHSRELAPVDIVSIAAVVPDDAIETVDVARLPSRWRDEPPPFELSAIGDRCVRTARSLALRVLSAVAPDDWNVLLNPAHERFGETTIETPREVKLDPRLFG